MKTAQNYTEIIFDSMGFDNSYKNPLTNVFQYEYALYFVVSSLFKSVKCKSRAIDSLSMYFKELPHKPEALKDVDIQKNEKKRRTQEGLLREIKILVDRDVIGDIYFPMMSECAAEVKTTLEGDGTHKFIFTDGIYGFSVHIDMKTNGHPEKLTVRNIGGNPEPPKHICEPGVTLP
ncbi:hypothetical protein SAMN02910292_00528 [Lachnospiraceae bacterium XBB2008]|nr:hypothetical protein SAMN02910292_00528 [Lachnospiraceae bacterium XBB2008]